MGVKIKLAERSVAGLKPGPAEYKAFDTQLPGFHVRVQPTGVKTYAVFYRTTEGKQRSLSLGRTDRLKAERARGRALSVLAEVQDGGDPSGARRAERAVVTMTDLYEDYLEKHARVRKKPNSVKGDEILWRLHLKPCLGDKRVTEVNLRDLDGFMSRMSHRKGSANRAMALLSKMMSLAVAWDLRLDNPCKRVQRYPENRKERFLKASEAMRVRAALDIDHDRGAATALMLLLLTGARRGEVLNARWEQVDLDPDLPLWIVPHETLKGATRIRRSLRRPLSDEAADLLRAWRKASPISPAGWVFPNTDDANNPRPDVKKIWDRVCTRAELTNVRVHDLRHSFASAAFNAGASLHVVGKALGHADVRTTERYAHVMDSSIRDVASAVSRVLR